MVGCFCLRLNEGPKEYGYSQKDYALIKAFSIDDHFKNHKVLVDIVEFIDESLTLDINHIVLSVNEKMNLLKKSIRILVLRLSKET